jgi:hypothetical protein
MCGKNTKAYLDAQRSLTLITRARTVASHLTQEADEYIHTNYSMDTLEEGKAACKAALQRSMGLPQRPDVPVIGFVGRLDQQKGESLHRIPLYPHRQADGVL